MARKRPSRRSDSRATRRTRTGADNGRNASRRLPRPEDSETELNALAFYESYRCSSSMRALFITHYFYPEVGAPQTRILETAKELRNRGHEVTILTGFPN